MVCSFFQPSVMTRQAWGGIWVLPTSFFIGWNSHWVVEASAWGEREATICWEHSCTWCYSRCWTARVVTRREWFTLRAGTSLVVRWLGLHASNEGAEGSIPGWGTKIPHAAQHKWKQINKKNPTKCRPGVKMPGADATDHFLAAWCWMNEQYRSFFIYEIEIVPPCSSWNE